MKNEDLLNVGKKAKKEKVRERPDLQHKGDLELAPGEMSAMIANALEIAHLPKVNMRDPGEVGRRIEEYYEICFRNDSKPSWAGIALSLGLDRQTLADYERGRLGKSPEVVEIIKRGRALLDVLMNDYMQNGKINPVSGIFLMKNTLGYKDQAEVVVTPHNPLGNVQDRAALEAKYAESIVIDVQAEPTPDPGQNQDG